MTETSTRRRGARVAAGLLALTAGTAGLGAMAPAHAAAAKNPFFQNWDTGRCIDDSRTHGLRANTCNGTNYQKFSVTKLANKSFVIRNIKTGRCLDDSVTYHLRGNACNNLIYQQWTVHTASVVGASVTLKNRKTGWCIDDSKAHNLRTYPCKNVKRQKFRTR